MVIRRKVAPLNPNWSDELSTAIADAIDTSDTKISILVLGPNLDGDEPGSDLRRHIIQKCKDEQFTTVLAEYQQMQELFSKLWGPVYDLCKMELWLACGKDKRGRNIIDGIVIIPSSAGSFIELGMFVFKEKIHKKMLVLFNKDHEDTMTDSFIGRGARMAFDNGRNAITKLMDYQDLDGSWSEVSEFLKRVQNEKWWHKWIKRARRYG